MLFKLREISKRKTKKENFAIANPQNKKQATKVIRYKKKNKKKHVIVRVISIS